MGYRIEADGKSVAYVSDHEPYGLALFGADPPAEQIGRGLRDGVVHVGDKRLIEWIDGAVDILPHELDVGTEGTVHRATAQKQHARRSIAEGTLEQMVGAEDVRRVRTDGIAAEEAR